MILKNMPATYACRQRAVKFGTKFYLLLKDQNCHMKVLETKVLRGPNYWSVSRHKLIQIKLDLEELEYRPTNSIPGFLDRLKTLLPSLYTHECSKGAPGG